MVHSMNSAGLPVASAHHRPVLREVGDGTKALASFSAALNNPDFSDVTFIVSGERNNGETTKVHAHRSLLAIRSSVFREMFFGGFPESNQKEIEVQQFSHEHFLAVLEWAYGGRTAMTARDVLGVLQAAAFYGFDDLVAECRALAERFIDEDNVLYLLEHAHAMQEDELVALALRYVARNAAHVLPQASWLHLGADCVEKVLRLEAIDCDEAVLLERTVRWLEDNTTLLREVDRATVDPFVDKAKKDKELEAAAATDTRPSAEPLVDRLFPLLRVSHVPAPMLVDRVRPLCPLYGAVRTRYVAALEQKLLPAHMFALDSINWMPPRAPTVISSIQVDVSPNTLLRDWTVAYTAAPGDTHLSATFFDAIPAHAVFVAAGEMIPGRTDAIAIVAVGFARHARTVARSQAPLVVEDGDICWMGSTTSFGFSPRPDGRAQHALHAAAATLTARIANGLRWNVGGAPTTPLGPVAAPSQPAGSRFIYWK